MPFNVSGSHHPGQISVAQGRLRFLQIDMAVLPENLKQFTEECTVAVQALHELVHIPSGPGT
jgi:hypothetical protein